MEAVNVRPSLKILGKTSFQYTELNENYVQYVQYTELNEIYVQCVQYTELNENYVRYVLAQ